MNKHLAIQLLAATIAGLALSSAGAAEIQAAPKSIKPSKVNVPAESLQPLAGNDKLPDQDVLRMQEAARAAAEAKRAQQVRQLEEARRLGPNPQSPDRASGTPLGEHGIDTDRAQADRARQGSRAQDCIRNPADCVLAPEHRGVPAGQPGSPASGMTKGDRSAASDTTTVRHSTDANGDKVTQTTTLRDDGSSTQRSQTRDRDSHQVVNESILTGRADGSWTSKGAERNPDGTTTVHSMAFDHNGHIDPKHPPEERVVGEPDSGPRGQPREDGSSGRPDNCNWNPILGRCTKQRVSVRDMTSQPSRGDEGTATTNSSARPRLGSEAVTNPGDAGYSVDRGGRRGTGKPYDPRDPADAFGQGVPKPPPEKH